MCKRIKRIIAFAVVLVTLCESCAVFAEESILNDYTVYDEAAQTLERESGQLNLPCPSAILMDIDTGMVIFEKDADTKRPIASVTKVMTLLLVMEALEEGRITLEETVTVSENAASMGGSQCFLEPGEQMSVHELLKAVTVASANDAAVALAEHLCGDMTEFVYQMNEKGKSLGMENVNFVNCTGLDDVNHHELSARDVALMSRELLKHKKIMEYTTIWMDSIRGGKFGLSNTNKLIRFYSGATGLKTGSTSLAKFCLSASAERNGFGVLCVVLGAENSKDRFSAAKTMMDYAFSTKAMYKPQIESVGEVKVWDGKKDSVELEYDTPSMLVDKGTESKIEYKVDIIESVTAPIYKGDLVGKITFTEKDKVIKEIPIVAKESIEKKDFWDIWHNLWSLFILQVK